MSFRDVLIDWLTASRYVKWLEARHMEQRQDYTERLLEKDNQIKILRTEVAALKLECDRMRSVLFGSQGGAIYPVTKPPVVPDFAGPDDWQRELQKAVEEQQHGTHEQRRPEVLEPSPDDGAPAFS